MSNEADEAGDIPDLGESQVGSIEGEGGSASRRRRLPIFRILLVALGLYALIVLFPGFRFALQGGEPRDLGAAAAVELTDDLHNSYVRVQGTPNREQAAQPQGAGYVYMALQESGGKIWAAVPVGEEAPADGLVGRFMRFADVGEYVQVADFLKESVDTVTIDVARDDFVRALSGDTSKLSLGPDDVVIIATAERDVDVQFGKQGFKAADAKAIVEGLGYPFVAGKGGKMHQFVARIPADKREQVKSELRGHLPEGVSPAHPRLGATYVVRTETYKAPGEAVKIEGELITFPFDERGKVERGYNLENGQLVERKVEGGRLLVALDDVNRIRIERPLSIPEGAFVLYVGDGPGGQLPWALLWVLVLLGLIAIPAVPAIKQALKPKAQAVEDVVE
jgi:hypothetical protein